MGIRRNPQRIPEPIIAEGADLTNPEALARIVARRGPFDVVYLIVTPDGYDDEGYRRAYVESAWVLCEILGMDLEDRRAREAAAPAGESATAPAGRSTEPPAGPTPPRLIFVSSTGVYGQVAGEPVDETSPTEPTSFTGRRTLEAEQIVAAATAGGRVEGVCMRLGGIYGPGRSYLIERVRSGAPCHAEPPRYTNRIHEDDAVGALVHLGALASVQPVYIGVDAEAATDCAVADFIADRLGRPRPERRVSRDAPGVGVRGGNKRCSSARLRESGYELRFPTYREGYAALISARDSA